MSKIEIFEAAGCCATSSVVVSDEAIKWNASTEWAKKNKEFLNTSGMESLPVTLLDGKLVMAGKLPTREDIARWAGIPLTQDWSEDSAQPRCCSIPRMP